VTTNCRFFQDKFTKAQMMQIPESSHPAWQKLVTGELKVDISFMAARLLLMRIISSIDNNRDQINKGIADIRNLYVMNIDLPNVQKDIERIFK
jgi:hypothetical protein